MPNVRELVVNGAQVRVDVAPETPLLFVLRDTLDLTGAKIGCGEGQCGACTALVDGVAATPASPRWGTASAGRGFGLAGSVEKGGYVATCAEVAVDAETRQVRLVRVVEAFECGAIVNPDGLRNQVQCAVVQAIGGALFEQVEFAEGRILTDRFSRYRVPGFADVPPIEVGLLDRPDLPSAGAGETPIVGLAPAVGNAIFDATAISLRALPLIPNELPQA